MLTIGEFARASGLSAKALRLYDELELLTPADVNPTNGYRYYAPEQVEQARLVARLRSAGVPLPRIATILGASTREAAADQVLSYWRQVEADRAAAREVITSLVALLRGQDNAVNRSTSIKLSLADLIAGLYEDLAEADDLARTSEAQLRARALSDLGEQLVDHFVTEAKLAGASWSEIGKALGVSEHAARERRAPNPFDRFTDLNRHSIVLAQEAARTHKHELIGTEHLLLGLLSEPRGLAYVVLTSQAGSEQRVRDAIEEAMAPAGKNALPGHIAFSENSKAVIEQALHASSDLGHDWVGTEHTLLGLIRAEKSLAAQILGDLGFTPDELHNTITAEITRRAAPSDE